MGMQAQPDHNPGNSERITVTYKFRASNGSSATRQSHTTTPRPHTDTCDHRKRPSETTPVADDEPPSPWEANDGNE